MKRRRLVAAVAAAAALAGVAVAAPVRAAATPEVAAISWSPCPDSDPLVGTLLKGLQCGSLQVPLDYSRPNGRKISLALTRAGHTAPADRYQGVVLLNRGQWPGQFGRDLPTRFATGTSGLPTTVGAQYDWIGFDPRGTGASEPMVTCDPSYLWPGQARPDYVPRTAAQERAWVSRAQDFAESCGRTYGDVLPFLSTKDSARDMDAIRRALGERQISYFGYDYGTYLGSVYASMFPTRVRRMVLDTVVEPDGTWYDTDLEQNATFENGARIYFSWIAANDATYHLGTTQAAVEANYYKGMDKVRRTPIDGEIGPSEYTDIFLVSLYRRSSWTANAKALADWVLRADPAGLRAGFGVPGTPTQNKQAMYNAVQCVDTPWPRGWKRWQDDYSAQYRAGNRFMTWYDAWYNAPCAFWPVRAGTPQKIGNKNVDVLLLQGDSVGDSPLSGALRMHRQFPDSRLVVERDGFEHETSMSRNANTCMNGYVSAFFEDGSRPASVQGVDASCTANPAPVPPASNVSTVLAGVPASGAAPSATR
ncbi:alpha/beta hydrolase [Streptomyces sp. NBC_01476]|uniref:alpha/beta fold hydrolase n=1 Tax=Streptomyces sp. NBC_01476 TaxID=2903881 RepID=UPI002E2EB3A9|nr:alpha/beta fold hydrolase [Streptomyces sp. NBC_01476]